MLIGMLQLVCSVAGMFEYVVDVLVYADVCIASVDHRSAEIFSELSVFSSFSAQVSNARWRLVRHGQEILL